MIVGHIGGAGAPYEIQKSLRFRANASAYLSRTPTVAGNRKTWTWSGWVKRGALGASFYDIFAAHTGNESTLLRFNADTFVFVQQNAGATLDANYLTTAVYRDPSAWCHVLLSVDTTQATAANRVFLYINGASVPLTASTTIAQNTDTHINRTVAHAFGVQPTQSAGYFDGYISEINFIDGQALNPSNFGQVSAETGSWIPKKYTGTHGTNGFYLPFNDGSTLGNLTADRSGNGNNWTANNISLTSGVTYDWMDDTPTNNFAVLNPLDGGLGKSSMTNGNLTATSSAGGSWPEGAYSTVAMPPGKWYCEISPESGADLAGIMIGVIKADRTDSRWYYNSTGNRYAGTVNGGAYGAAYTNGNIIGVAYDSIAGVLTFYRDGVSQGVAYSSMQGEWLFGVCDGSSGANLVKANANFGQRPFAYSPPAGFKALCTKNLPTPSILNPKKHFDVVLATGANIKSTVEALYSDQALMVVKDRANANNWQWFNDVTGLSAILQSNTTSAETTYSAPTGSSVGYGWKAGGAPVTNNAGSIQSQVSANPQAGFSIVTYSGQAAAGTVGHGLWVAPKLIIVKERNNVRNWFVLHNADALRQFEGLNTTSASTAAVAFQSTAPSSTVFSVTAGTVGTNGAGSTFTAYCFAEIPGYSKIGSYTGNGSADGPFVYCGFRPRYVLIKRVDTAGNWRVVDTSRSTYNANGLDLYPNRSNAEGAVAFDFLSNGIKPRVTDPDYNASGGSYIFYAVAEQPFQFANAR